MFQELACEHLFGRMTDSQPTLGIGWSGFEDGFIWAVGNVTKIFMDGIGTRDNPTLEIWVTPYTHPTKHPFQRIFILINDIPIGSTIAKDSTVITFALPKSQVKDSFILEFRFPDSVSPNSITDGEMHDTRHLSFSFTKIRVFFEVYNVIPPKVKISAKGIFASFESVGDNCDVGMLQRQLGLEILGLLRFSGQPIQGLIKALDERFSSLGDINAFEVIPQPTGTQYDVYIKPYRMFYHTHVEKESVSPDVLIKKQQRHLIYLASKFIEVVEEGSKVFVYKRSTYLRDAEILSVHNALKRLGPAAMLAVRRADNEHQPGSIDIISPGLLCGYVTGFRETGSDIVPYEQEWTSLFRKSLMLL